VIAESEVRYRSVFENMLDGFAYEGVMADAARGDVFKPGDECPRSGIYRVVHGPYHAWEHDVTVIYGKHFPPCDHCGDQVRFVFERGAQHIEHNKHFKG
jgi:hypothetical protein